jgi:drug/metabolite transporter (DMT)-like permease
MQNSNEQANIPFVIYICIWATVILWASALIGIKIGLKGYTPGGLALLRYLIASFSLIFLYIKIPNRRIPPLKDALHITFIGIMGIGIYNIAINYGEIVVPAGVAGFIVGLMPVFTMVFAFILLKERVPLKCWWGVLISLLGLFLIAFNEHAGFNYDAGVLYILLAAILGSYYAVAQKALFHRYHPFELVILSIWGGTLILFFYLPDMIKEIPAASWQATAAAVYLGIFPAAIAYALWNYAISKAPAGRASAYLYAMPIIAALLGMIILKEYPTPLELTGGLITLAGAVSINYFYKHARDRSP